MIAMATAQLAPVSTPPAAPAQRYFNRELSWLAFNRRVLEEAGNPRHPLLERVRFLSISDSNLDEFFMVRVAGLRGQIAAGVGDVSPDGLTPAQQREAIQAMTRELVHKQEEIWRDLKRELGVAGIQLVEPAELGSRDRDWLAEYFAAELFQVLTPLAI